MVFFLVMVNTTVASQFTLLFHCIYFAEILISLLLLSAVPLAVYTVMGMTLLHRNIRLSVAKTDITFIVANLARESVAGWSIAIPIALSTERTFATIFSSWYEKESPATLLVFVVQSLILEVYAWTNAVFLIYDACSIQFNVISYGATFTVGAVLFQYVLTMNVEYSKRLQKMSSTAYSLSKTYQIRENIKIMQVLRKLAFPTLIFNIPAFTFISLHIFLPCEKRFEVVRNVSVAFFDLWIALYALSFALLTYNLEPRLQESLRRFSLAVYFLDRYDEMTGRIRKLTMSSPSTPQHNESDIYFSMLSNDLHGSKKSSTVSKISIIEI